MFFNTQLWAQIYKKTCQCSGQKPLAEDLCKKLGLVLVLVQARKVLSLFKDVPAGNQLLC